MSGVSSTVPVPYYFWTSPAGASSSSQCTCQQGYTGTNCEYSTCPATLPGASLGAMLFQADAKLRQFVANASAYAVIDINAYLYNLLHVGVDVNGDGNITTTEMLTALSNRLVYSTGMTQLPLWCQSARAASQCYRGLSSDMVEVSIVYGDAVSNFIAEGTFDGSGKDCDTFIYINNCLLGIATLRSINATYPKPSWSIDTCRAYDHSINAAAIITTKWVINPNPPINRVCGYVNGILNNEFSSSAVLSGKQTFFDDSVPVSSVYLNKRVYCITVEYCDPPSQNVDYMCLNTCPPNTSPSSSNPAFCSPGNIHRVVSATSVSYQCAVGLIYDGTPVEMNPQLGWHGVAFSFVDTSSSETRFDIFVGEVGGDDATKTNVVTIPTGLAGCGRTANPISFTDQISSMSVGQIKEYAISATQEYPNNVVMATEMFKFPYRIPFLVQVNGEVKYQGGGGVQYVKIAFCHLDRATKLPDSNTHYCPLITLISDIFGHFSGEIRVSDP